MKSVFLVAFAASIALLAGSVPVPATSLPEQVPPATAPVAQAPRATAPTAQAPTAQAPQPVAPTVYVPQAVLPNGQTPQEAAAAGQPFQATWSANGQRQTLPTEAAPAVTIQLSGALSITTGSGLSRGFRGEVLGFDDGAGLAAGRAVWTDERGDRIFSVLQGDTLAAGTRQIRAVITGGTGRYAGLTGEYEFTWRHLIAVENTQINGQAANLHGYVHPGSAR